MNRDFKRCLENKKLTPFAKGKGLVKKEISVARSDLDDAQAGYENKYNVLKYCLSRPKVGL